MTGTAVHIIGGAGDIGRWFIRKVFYDSNPVYCYDINQSKLSGFGGHVKTCHIDDGGYSRYRDNFGTNDWVIYAAASQSIEVVLADVVPILKDETLLVSMTSVQEKSGEVLRRLTPVTCTFLGCHPLFGPGVPSPIGQLAALINFNEHDPQHSLFREHLSVKGIIATELSARNHDRYMAVVQALTHFCLLTFAKSLLESGLHPSDLLRLKTPNFQFLYAFASRVLKLSPATIGAIQHTPDAAELRSTFVRVADILHKSFEEQTSEHGCSQVVSSLREPLTGAEVDEGAEVAAVAVDSLQRFEALLHKHCVSRDPFVFRHRVSNKLHVVRIVRITPDEIRCEESTRQVKVGDRVQLAVGLSDNARLNYSKMGINLPLAKEYVTKKRNIKLMDADEFKEFHRNVIYPTTVLRTFGSRREKTEAYYEEWLPKLVKGLWRCKCMEAFKRRGEEQRVVLRLIFNPNTARDDLFARVRSLVEREALMPATNQAMEPTVATEQVTKQGTV